MQSELNGLLIFAQALEEMLFHHTVDSFKAPALNIHSSVLELRFLAVELANSRIRSGTLIPVIQELEHMLKTDPLLSSSERTIIKTYVDRLKKAQNSTDEMISICDAVLIELRVFYWESLRNRIIESVKHPKNKKEIIELARTFVTEAELHGFSRGFIYYRTRRFYFDENSEPTEINSIGQISDFLERFYNYESSWKVIFRGSRTFNKMIEHANAFNLQISLDCPTNLPHGFKIDRFLGESSSFPAYIMAEKIRLQDPLSARQYVNEQVKLLSAVYSFICHEEGPKLNPIALVINESNNKFAILKPSPSPLRHAVQRQDLTNNSELPRLIEILRGDHFDYPSTYLFTKSIDYHHAAMENDMPENQLIDLWASLEGFLPAPTGDDNRISHFVAALIPSLTLTYSEKLFRYLADCLYYGGHDVRQLINGLPVGSDFFEKTIAITVSEDLQNERNELFAALEDHLLLRYRVFQMYESFKSKRYIKETVLTHKQRVAWHIQRIYTTRNQIVHSAESLPYLETLVENLHSYMDSLLNTLSIIGAKSPSKLNIPGALKVLSIHEQEYIHGLTIDSHELCNSVNNIDFIFGRTNPVSPFNESLTFYV